MTIETRTQLRASCPHCFATQAIRATGRLVAHGYTRPSNWHSNEGTCRGAGAMNFGTEAGRDYTAKLAERLDTQAIHADETAIAVLAGASAVMVLERVSGRRLYMEVVKGNPTESDRARYAAQLTRSAANLRTGAVELRAAVAAWQPVEPKAVVVEAKASGPLVHWVGGYWAKFGGHKACASSNMAAQACNNFSRDIAHVTCEKCKKVAAVAAAKAVA